MKTVKKDAQIKRVRDKYAQELVYRHGWSFCPKHEFKGKEDDKPKKKSKKD